MRKIIMVLLIMVSIKAAAQEEIINNTTLLIAEGKYNDAEKYLDSLIHAEPKNVTALMMKGNVLLNYALAQTPSLHNITSLDESIFSKDVASLKSNIVVIPKATTQKVEQLWKRCLEIDPSREDIEKGLCSLYGMSLMRNELLAYLPVLSRSANGKNSDFAYTMVEYARLLQERGDKEGAYLVYKKTAEIYPTVSGIWCMLAAAYFADDDLVHTREYAERGITTVNADMIACRDALDIYTAIGDPVKVLPMLKIADRDSSFREYPFYLGLYKYTHHDTSWVKDINSYLAQFPIAADSNPVFNAALYMVTDKFTDDYKGLMSLLNYKLNDLSTRMIAERAIHEYKDSTAPYLIEMQVLINDKQYAKANSLLSVLTKQAPKETGLIFYYAYSLYSAGDYKTALIEWARYTEMVKVTKPANPDTYLAAPYYFTGQSYLKSGNKEKAKEYFKMILAGKDDSKYAYLAKIMTDKLSK